MDRMRRVRRTSRTRNFTWQAACLLASVSLLTTIGSAQEEPGWAPERNVTMVVPFSPGGGSDIFGRAMASGLEEVVPGLTVAVENRTGGSGAIGYSFLLNKRGDPHYLLPSETSAVSLPITTDVAFHWSDFTPIAQVAEDAVMMVVREESEFETIHDVIAAGKEEALLLGVAGANGVDSINGALLEQDQGIELQRVVFQSGGELIVALLAGDIDIAMLNPGEVMSYIESDDLRPILVFAENRYQGEPLADVPTSIEEGIDVAFSQYRGPFAAGDLTDEQRAFWEQAFRDYVESDQYQKYISDAFLIPTTRFGEDFEAFLTDYEADLKTAFEVLND